MRLDAGKRAGKNHVPVMRRWNQTLKGPDADEGLK